MDHTEIGRCIVYLTPIIYLYILAGRQSADFLKVESEIVRIHFWCDSYTSVSTQKDGIYNDSLPWPKLAIHPFFPPPNPSTISVTAFVIASLVP